jgi:hypothetical protein
MTLLILYPTAQRIGRVGVAPAKKFLTCWNHRIFYAAAMVPKEKCVWRWVTRSPPWVVPISRDAQRHGNEALGCEELNAFRRRAAFLAGIRVTIF